MFGNVRIFPEALVDYNQRVKTIVIQNCRKHSDWLTENGKKERRLKMFFLFDILKNYWLADCHISVLL